MPLNNSIEDLDPELKMVYEEAKASMKRDFPAGPWPELNETARSKAVQDAYYARGRKPYATVRALYKAAGLYDIGVAEAAKPVTNAQFGQSAHNAAADEYSPALDVRFRLLVIDKPGAGQTPPTYKAGKEITWEARWFTIFGGYMLAAASKLLAAGKITQKVVWGNDWNGNGKRDDSSYDPPHYELKNWRLGRKKKPKKQV